MKVLTGHVPWRRLCHMDQEHSWTWILQPWHSTCVELSYWVQVDICDTPNRKCSAPETPSKVVIARTDRIARTRHDDTKCVCIPWTLQCSRNAYEPSSSVTSCMSCPAMSMQHVRGHYAGPALHGTSSRIVPCPMRAPSGGITLTPMVSPGIDAGCCPHFQEVIVHPRTSLRRRCPDAAAVEARQLRLK